MTLRPGRPVIPVKQCMFEKCRSTHGKDVNIDGKHGRVLCDDHAAGVRDIWQNRRSAFHVSWGRSSEEKRAEDERLLEKLLAEYGEPDWQELPEPDFGSEAWWSSSDEEDEVDWVPSDKEKAWEEIERLRWEIDDIEFRGYHPPTVRVRPRTE